MAKPAILYHYTSIDGFLGIVTNKTLRATYVRHMNDGTEYMYAHSLVSAALDSESRKATPEVGLVARAVAREFDPHFLEIASGFSAAWGGNFIASLSEMDDQLSQWRAYCPRGGYCLGFRTPALDELCKHHKLRLVPCNYDKVMHGQVAAEIAERVVSVLSAKPAAELEDAINENGTLAKFQFEPVVTKMKDELSTHAYVWKHPAFHEEREWRIVSQQQARKLKFRAGKHTAIPYIDLELDVGANTDASNNCMVLAHTTPAPSAEPSLAAMSAMLALQASKVSGATIMRSKVPYREW